MRSVATWTASPGPPSTWRSASSRRSSHVGAQRSRNERHGTPRTRNAGRSWSRPSLGCARPSPPCRRPIWTRCGGLSTTSDRRVSRRVAPTRRVAGWRWSSRTSVARWRPSRPVDWRSRRRWAPPSSSWPRPRPSSSSPGTRSALRSCTPPSCVSSRPCVTRSSSWRSAAVGWLRSVTGVGSTSSGARRRCCSTSSASTRTPRSSWGVRTGRPSPCGRSARTGRGPGWIN